DRQAPFLKSLMEHCDAGVSFRIVGGRVHEYADPPCVLSLLRARRERPRRCRRAANERDERAPLHSITSSARTSSAVGTVSPNDFAVFRLIISSTLADCCTGRSAGRSPLRIRPA